MRYAAFATPLCVTRNGIGMGNEHDHRNIIPHRICSILALGFLGSSLHNLPHDYACGMCRHLDGHHNLRGHSLRQQSDDSHIFEITVDARETFQA